ncbi:MAG: oxidoreductase, partial [Candidatus Omnitrophota bacterium]
MTKAKEIPVVWLQGATCTGCSVSILNSVSPTIKNVLIDQLIPGTHINLKFHATIMAGTGEMVIKVLEDTAKDHKGGYLLVVEGSIPTKEGGLYCCVGEKNKKPIPFAQHVKDLAKNALACVALGTCS